MDLDKSALKLIDLQNLLTKPFDLSKMNVEYNNFLNILEFEFGNKTRGITGFHPHRVNCFQFLFGCLQKTLKDNFVNFQKWLIDSFEIIYERTTAINTWGILLNIIRNPQHTAEKKAIGACFSYLATVEGFFERDLKICYSLMELSKGNYVDINELEKYEIADIKGFLENENVDFLFQGWNRNLRNAIAHFSFKWDNINNQLTFRDHYFNKFKKNWTDWKKSYSLNQLIDINQKAVNVNQAVTTMFAIMDIQDCCYGNRRA